MKKKKTKEDDIPLFNYFVKVLKVKPDISSCGYFLFIGYFISSNRFDVVTSFPLNNSPISSFIGGALLGVTIEKDGSFIHIIFIIFIILFH